MRAAFLRDVAKSQQITLEEWRDRSIGVQLKEKLARLWEYWL
jgi:cardiolipin synthase